MRNASGRCVSSNSGEPTFSSPTSAATRASVSSSFSGSGAAGINSPPCATRGFTGAASRCTFSHRRSRRMRAQIELHQLQKSPRIAHRHGQAQGALVLGSILQRQPQPHLVRRQPALRQPAANVAQQARQHEGERLQQLHRIVQLHLLAKLERIFQRDQRPLQLAARQRLQPHAFRTEPSGDADGRQHGQIAERAEAPAVEGLEQFFAGRRAGGAAAIPETSPRRRAGPRSRRRIRARRRWPHRDWRRSRSAPRTPAGARAPAMAAAISCGGP